VVKIPVTNWTTSVIDGREYLIIEVAQFRIPLDWDPGSNMFIAVASPDGGLGSFPALVQGDDGATPDIDLTINLSVLDYDNPLPDAASWTEISENLYRLNLTLHKNAPIDFTSFNLGDADDLAGSKTAGYAIVVNPSASGYEYQALKVGDEYWPATIVNTPSGNAAYTLCSVSIPAQPFDWRPDVSGWCVITGTGADVRADLVARLNDATSGNIVGRGRGLIGTNASGIATVLTGGPPAGSASTYNKVNAGDAAVIYLRVERTTGSNTFTTTGTDTWFKVRVRPIP
jgi:hypothetical protein